MSGGSTTARLHWSREQPDVVGGPFGQVGPTGHWNAFENHPGRLRSQAEGDRPRLLPLQRDPLAHLPTPLVVPGGIFIPRRRWLIFRHISAARCPFGVQECVTVVADVQYQMDRSSIECVTVPQ